MKKVFINILFLITIVLISVTSCYDDKGNYTYKEINDIFIDAPKEIGVRIPKHDSVLVEIRPVISQKDKKNNDNLQYLWQKKTYSVLNRDWTTVSQDSVCRIYVKPTDTENLTIRLAVTDKELDIISYSETLIKLIAPFSNAWFVLQSDGTSPILGVVDGEKESAIVIPNIYSEEQSQGEPLMGSPISLEVNPRHSDPNVFYGIKKETILRILTSTGGYTLEGNTLRIRHHYDEMLLHKKLKGEPLTPQVLSIGDNYGEFIIDDGTFWYTYPDGFDIYYPAKMNDALGASYYAEHAALLKDYAIIYDKKERRFLRFLFGSWSNHYFTQRSIRGGSYSQYDIDGRINNSRLESIGESANAPNAFDPEEISNGERLVYMGNTSNSDNPKCLALMQSGNQVYVYEINRKGFESINTQRCSGFFSVQLEGLPETWSFATSTYFDRMFFYSTGNKIYRVDLNRAIPRSFLVYEHPNTEIKFTQLKFRHQQRDKGEILEDDSFVPFEMPSYLGASLEYPDGENAVMEMKIAPRGDIDVDNNNQMILYEWKGFNKIIDIGYSFRFD